MISLCNSTVERQLPFTKIMCQSIAKRSKLISEVCVTISDVENYSENWIDNGIKFTFRGGKPLLFPLIGKELNNTARCIQHAAGLSRAVEMATNDYIILSDPDIFYRTPVDEIFYDLLKVYNLDIVGVSHPAALTQSFTFYPNVIHSLVRRSSLCDEGFLRNNDWLLKHPHMKEVKNAEKVVDEIKYLNLTPCAVKDNINLYPNQNGHFECGSNLCLYGIMHDWKWLSFQTTDVHNYTTQYFKSNIKIKERIQRKDLFYHQVGSAGIEHGYLKGFIQLYNEFETEN